MRRQEDLQVKLRERFRQLLTTRHDSYVKKVETVRSFVSGDPYLRSLLEEAARSEPELDAQKWIDTLRRSGLPQWPHRTEAGQASLSWELMCQVADGVISENEVIFLLGGERRLNDATRRLTEVYFEPLFNYLIERVGDQSSVLHALMRYVRVVEWFDRDTLLAEFEQNTRQGEAVYDRHLRRFLFSEGIDMPYSQAQSPSGESDVLAVLDTEEPLVCEVKVFDGEGRGKRHVASGVQQVAHYADDYGKSEAYLVIVNLSGRQLELPTDDGCKTWPPYIDLAGVRVYLVTVRAKRVASASRLGTARPVVINRDDLVNPDAED